MGHKIFSKNFDDPQNIILCASFPFLLNIFKKFMGVGAQSLQTKHQGDLKNKAPRYMKNGSKKEDSDSLLLLSAS